MSAYRPRGALSRAIFHKLHNDVYLDNLDLASLYSMEQRDLPADYQKKFIHFEPDQRTKDWLEQSKSISGNLWLQIWFTFAKFCLSIFLTQTDLNGMLSRGSMFILSEDQLVTILSRSGLRLPANGGAKVLDIGAGDGKCTARVQTALQGIGDGALPHMYVTETSWIMRRRLEKYENFSVIEVPDVKKLSNMDFVSCLNVLDRCGDPHQMLTDIHNILSPTGRAMFALVLPYSHYVETNTSHMPVRPLLSHYETTNESRGCDCEQHCEYNKRRPSFEEETRIFFDTLREKGFKIESWTKAPYLCEGDIRQSFYWLIDIVVVVSKVVPSTSKSGK